MEGKVLSLSQRRIANLVAYCVTYEFEDTFASLTDATRIESMDFPSLEFSRRAYKFTRLASRSPKLARSITPRPRGSTVLDSDYELFFATFNHTHELYSLASIPNWKKRCRKAACFVLEAWSDMLPPYLVELLADFDHIFVGCRNSVPHLGRMTGRPCTYLPPAVDALRFAPTSLEQTRSIYLSYIGRRSDVTHRAMLEEAERKQLFYYYDTVAASGLDLKHRTFRVDRPAEHRSLLATLLKNSRYFVANRSYVNRPEFTAEREEISPRFYEGAGSGAVMIGEAPRTPEFRTQFDWPDAVIHVPFDSPDIALILSDLDSNPQRLHTARLNNVRHVTRRHDWLHRIQTVFDTLDLPYTEKMQVRAHQLNQIAAKISGNLAPIYTDPAGNQKHSTS
jgi:hypothetical protein